MRLVSYIRNGITGYGAVVNGGIVDLTGKIGLGIASLKLLLAADSLVATSEYVNGRSAEFALSDVQLLPVIPDPGKILCVGLNYQKHKEETGRPDVDHPTIFTRFADTLVAHQQALIKPESSQRFDYEAEMAVIIGRGGRHISLENAMSHVAGYSCFNEGSIRNWQRHTSQFTPGKNFPATGAFGPCLVTADEVGDYRRLSIQSRLNGQVMQDGKLSELIFPVEQLISYISGFTPLSPGDVIVSGTPGGVGDRMEPPVYMFGGDKVEVEIGMLGTLVNPVVDEYQL